MKPKEKAIQLVNKYLKFTSKHDSLETAGLGALTLAKACALVVVDEILDEFQGIHSYWAEVKQEINNL